MAEYVDPAHIDPHPAPPAGGRHRLAEERAVLHPGPSGEQLVAELEQPVPAHPSFTASGRTGHVAAFGALAATLAVQVAQGLVSVPPESAQGISAPVWHGVLTGAQVVLVVAAAYGMRPGQPR